MDELKLCPLCGGEAQLKVTRRKKYYVECILCGKQANRNYIVENAIASWNRARGKT